MQKSHSTYTIQKLPLNQLERDPEHPRHLYEEPDELYPLLASIRALCQMEAIAVCPTQGGKYVIVDGNRRFRCAQQLRHATIYCKVYPALSRGEIMNCASGYKLSTNRELYRKSRRPKSISRRIKRRQSMKMRKQFWRR